MTDTTITSRRHPLVARCRDAADGHTDDVLLDGPHLVADAIDAGLALPVIVLAEGADTRPDIAAIVRRAEQQGRLVQRVTPAVFDAASPARTPAGILALATLAMRDVSHFAMTSQALLTVAVGIQDPGNVGMLIRSSEAAGATGLVATGGTAHPFGWKALRGAMGSSLRLPVARIADARDALRTLHAHGLRLVALAADGDVDLYQADLHGPLAVCAGAEGAGLPDDVRAMADLQIRIPMRPPVESLNVGVAASLVLFEVARQRRNRGSRESGVASE
ncbi:Putative TrmH family tRNA/rRNA methyltransferase [Luteitalea pratensis]|uniref:TrmH family tRNA/rRNA methyltransferase n=1 Tax=Luteitalea pratensis TaxID=1855912 RepID=A0A143PQ81_LUTPR|nr:RNA methyltransferase [Luteitalea pratensis]AMY09974.1 Putative TrmH family tRNA/rRNA methyltransferase [Luteitalea pratensis]